MRLPPSTRLGPYEIVSPLGAGGMGEVYRARDTRLGREVAIKVLPEHLVAQPDVRARFEREARTISSLNHPHICTLHDVGREGDVQYLVMELVEGETLAERLSRGPLAQTELLRLATQIADALDRAHRAGIVHRDFKPGNVMVTKGGAKLMDFGLARAAAGGAAPGTSSTGVTIAQLSQSPTVVSPLTGQGALLGTFLYMAPEQLEGKEADSRSDIWAFGCVLYEMATGRRAFEGKSQASLIGAIMNSEPPPIAATNSAIAPGLDALVRACLAKDPEERIQTAHDIKLQLGWLGQPASQSGVAAPVALPAPRSRGRESIAWGVAALAGVAAAVLAWLGPLKPMPEPQQIRFDIPIPGDVVDADMPIISPDGRTLAFSAQDSTARRRIWIRPLNSLVANPLPGTDNAGRPFWSPDSRYLAFMADGKLKKIAIAGGPVEVIANAPSGADGTWGKHGDILYDGAANDPIMRVAASGGVPDTAIASDTTAQVGWPAFLPDGKHYFYTVLKPTESEVMLGTLGAGPGRSLGILGSRVAYSPDGYLMFARDRALLAQRFDPGARKLAGEPFPVAENLPVAGNAQANFTVSSNGVLVYRATGEILSRLVWLDRAGRELAEVAGTADFRAPALSPDARRVVIRRRDGEGANLDLWMFDLARGTSTRFTFDPAADGNPIWSPDGSRIVWNGERNGVEGLYEKSASGVGEERLLVGFNPAPVPTSWSPDGRHVLFNGATAGGVPDLYVVSLEGDRTPRAIASTPFAEARGAFSPDGRWIAYQSNESGRAEVYVIPFEGPAGKWQVSTRGGSDPAWSPDGRELYYLTDDNRFMSVPIAPGDTFNPGTPHPLFTVRVEPGLRRNVYCVAPDNQRFLFQVPVGETNTPMTAVVNWRAGLGRR